MPLLNDTTVREDLRRRKAVRRNAIILGCVALAFYIGFIVMSVSRAQ